MNDLIAITTNDKQEPVISGRELHQFLEVGTEYAKWFERMAEYGFSADVDFSSVLTESTGGRPATDHALSLDMAKELCTYSTGAVWYCNAGAWVRCETYFGVDGQWQRVAPQYGDSGLWKPLG